MFFFYVKDQSFFGGVLLFLATVGFRGFGHDGGRSVSVLHVACRGRHHSCSRTGREADRQGPEGQCTKNDFFHNGLGLSVVFAVSEAADSPDYPVRSGLPECSFFRSSY